MDSRLLETQEWLNETYRSESGFTTISEDGTSRSNTFHALIRALQIELGISPTSSNFGDETAKKFKSLSKQSEGDKPTNLN